MNKRLTNNRLLPLKTFLIGLLIFSFSSSLLFAQAAGEPNPYALVDKALGGADAQTGLSIYFEGIAYGIDQPARIFKLPAYQVHRGGYMLSSGKKCEVQLGLMKALCDGKLLVMIDEQAKTMVVDSVRESMPGFAGEAPDQDKLIDQYIGKGDLRYEGKEPVNGKVCHKIKAFFEEDPSTHVYYWIEEATNKLLLMAEWQSEAYDTYWIKKVSKSPANHNYAIHLPKRELDELYGYQVVDFRYTADALANKNAR